MMCFLQRIRDLCKGRVGNANVGGGGGGGGDRLTIFSKKILF